MIEPKDEAELAEAVRDARGPMWLRGGGTRGVVGVGDVLSLAGLEGIRLYEPAALTLVAGAGTPLAEVEAVLAAEGQRLAFEPADWRGLLGTQGEATIGGVVAGNISGPRRVQAGACRDALLGVRFVDGTGAVVKNGGRVMKNVTGYDLARLMAGSWGTLGALSEVSLKVLPRAKAIAQIEAPVDGLEAAVAVMAAALGSPYDVTGAAYVSGHGVAIRVEGLEASVAYRADKLVALLGAARVERDPDVVRENWRAIRDVAMFHGMPGDVWRVSVRPSDAPAVAARLGEEQMFDWGGGLIWALLPEGTDARARISAFAGHATLVRASDATFARIARFQPEPPTVAGLTAGLRARFDPRGIFNPGLMSPAQTGVPA